MIERVCVQDCGVCGGLLFFIFRLFFFFKQLLLIV